MNSTEKCHQMILLWLGKKYHLNDRFAAWTKKNLFYILIEVLKTVVTYDKNQLHTYPLKPIKYQL